jgi:hypothetical protein
VLALIRDGRSISEVIKEIWGVAGGSEYQRRASFVLELIRAALGGVK